MKKINKKILSDVSYIVITIFIITALYEVVFLMVNNDFIVPDIKDIIKSVFNLLLSGKKFWKPFLFTLLRTLCGFALSFIFSLFLVIIYKFFKLSQKFVTILISIFRATPTIAIILNLLFWTNSTIAPIIIACLVTLPQLYSSILESIDSFDKQITDMCHLYKVKDKEIFFKVYLPYVMPRTALTLCSNFSLTLKLIGSSEALCSTLNSIGYLMKDASASFDPARLIAISLISIATAIILEYSLKFVITKIWRIK